MVIHVSSKQKLWKGLSTSYGRYTFCQHIYDEMIPKQGIECYILDFEL